MTEGGLPSFIGIGAARCSTTAIHLAALAQRRPRTAARLLAAWPVLGTRGIARQVAPIVLRRTRRRLYERPHAGPTHEPASEAEQPEGAPT